MLCPTRTGFSRPSWRISSATSIPVLFHGVDLIGFVALAVAPQIDGDATVIGREVLLLEPEACPIAETAVYEDDGRVAGAHFVDRRSGRRRGW